MKEKNYFTSVGRRLLQAVRYDMSARIQLWMKEKSEEECSKNEQC